MNTRILYYTPENHMRTTITDSDNAKETDTTTKNLYERC